jgi:hypothetical protein
MVRVCGFMFAFQLALMILSQQVKNYRVIIIIIIIIIIITISLMQGIYTYIPETKRVPKEYNVATIMSLLFMAPILLLLLLLLSSSSSSSLLSPLCSYIPEANVSTVYTRTVAAVLYLRYVLQAMLFLQ